MPRASNGGLSVERLRDLARAGAELTLNRLRGEIAAIERAFPELAKPAGRRATAPTVQAGRKRVRRMSAAARKSVSERMKRYWADRRKLKAKPKG
jgi:hypothetical protein